jgi:DNA replication and repair protein RecF
MAEHGVAITSARQEMLARLAGELSEDIAGFPRAQSYLSGTIEGVLDQGTSALDAEGLFAERLKHERPIDIARRRCGVGPHRSEWTILHHDKQREAGQCSTGEQKALLLAITLASARARAKWCGVPPILLLDEVIAHLDEVKRAQLFGLIRESRIQAWMTGTDAGDFRGLDGYATVMEVSGGKVIQHACLGH